MTRCPDCGGHGRVSWNYDDPEVLANVEAVAPCPRCWGTGEVNDEEEEA